MDVFRSVLNWDKPARVRSSKEHAESYQADGAPPGTFVSNMSSEDNLKWKAKLVGYKTGYPQVEIRRDGFVIIVSLKGYKYRHYDFRQTPENLATWQKYRDKYKGDDGTIEDDKKVVHIASAGPAAFSVSEFSDFMMAIAEAFDFLRKFENGQDQVLGRQGQRSVTFNTGPG